MCNPVALGLVQKVLQFYNIRWRNAVTFTLEEESIPIPNEYIISISKNNGFLRKTKINLKCVLYFQQLLNAHTGLYGDTFEIIIDYGNLLTLDGKPLDFLQKYLRNLFKEITPEESGQFEYLKFSALGLGGSIRKKNSKLKCHKSRRKNKSHLKNKSRRKNKSHRKNKSRRRKN